MIGTKLRLSFAQATPEHIHPFVISVFWTSVTPFVLLQETEKTGCSWNQSIVVSKSVSTLLLCK